MYIVTPYHLFRPSYLRLMMIHDNIIYSRSVYDDIRTAPYLGLILSLTETLLFIFIN